MVIPLCPFKREYSGNASYQPQSSGPTSEPTYLLPYISIPTCIYISNVQEPQIPKICPSPSDKKIVLRTLFWHVSPKNFPVKVSYKSRTQERRNWGEPLDSLMASYLRVISFFLYQDLRRPTRRLVFQITFYDHFWRRPENSTMHISSFVSIT